jgi:hypothetical protein
MIHGVEGRSQWLMRREDLQLDRKSVENVLKPNIICQFDNQILYYN